ncbi:hypothetical protein KDD93_01220 [Campylobacter sp. faydin G-24]|uniref:Uncharacterized protein n=1 Tax=Campylobacter anatolicus TaxID=2829105 RepID=A0ABS5HG00_9BACT|nr:hypothetical protein [Campylobacter anatolicus]MBR8463195.1 hypothetical protein [Campylobacter anatolicus]
MKKFLVVLTLLFTYVQSYDHRCNYSEVKADIEKWNSKLPVKIGDNLTLVNTSCNVYTGIELTIIAPDEFFKIFNKSDERGMKRAMCLNPNKILNDWFPFIGVMTETFINESFTKSYRIRVTGEDCESVRSGF